MSGYVESLARRGAGLQPPAGTAVAQARPQGRFEAAVPALIESEAIAPSVAPIARGAADIPLSREAEQAEARPAASAAFDAPRRPPKPWTEHEGGDRDRREAAAPAARQRNRIAPAAPIGDEAAAPSRPDESNDIAMQGAASTAAWPGSERVAPAAAGPPQGRSTSPPIEPLSASERAPAQGENVATAEAVTRPEQSRFEPPAPRREVDLTEDPRPTVTVSIGRIEVEVAPPPAQNAPRARFEPTRTRGFADYARARRGHPR